MDKFTRVSFVMAALLAAGTVQAAWKGKGEA